MGFRRRFHHLVQEDYDEVFEWYEKQQMGLGERFIDAVRITVDQIIL